MTAMTEGGGGDLCAYFPKIEIGDISEVLPEDVRQKKNNNNGDALSLLR